MNRFGCVGMLSNLVGRCIGISGIFAFFAKSIPDTIAIGHQLSVNACGCCACSGRIFGFPSEFRLSLAPDAFEFFIYFRCFFDEKCLAPYRFDIKP